MSYRSRHLVAFPVKALERIPWPLTLAGDLRMAMAHNPGATSWANANPSTWQGAPTATGLPAPRGKLAVLAMAMPKMTKPTTNPPKAAR